MFIKVGKRLNKKAVIIFFVITAFLQKKMMKKLFTFTLRQRLRLNCQEVKKWSIP